MSKKQTNKRHNNAYEVTDHIKESRWGRAIQSLAAVFKKFHDPAASPSAARAARAEFFRQFRELTWAKAKATLLGRGFEGGARENAEDAASDAVILLLKQEKAGRGVFGFKFADDEALCRYLSGAISRGAKQRVSEVLQGHSRARGLSPKGTEALVALPDPRQDIKLQQVCMDVREVSLAIAPKYKGRLPEAGKTPLNELILNICLDKVESEMAKRSVQRLKKDIREDLRGGLGL